MAGLLKSKTLKDAAKGARHTLLGPTGGALFAASAVSLAAWQEMEHRRVTSADLEDAPVRVSRLSDLRGNSEALAMIESGLRQEWGPFGLLGFDSIDAMLRDSGATVFVALLREDDGRYLPQAALQTTLGDFHGHPEALQGAFPSFRELTSARAMRRAAKHGGDTAVLLQITTFQQAQRGLGIGSLLRDAGLNLLDAEIQQALTMTPVDVSPGKRDLMIEDAATYTPAMRFHGHGGAVPTILLPGYKTPPAGETSSHGSDIVVMRYARDAEGAWPVLTPPMRLHRRGPLQERFIRTRRSLVSRLRHHEAPAAAAA